MLEDRRCGEVGPCFSLTRRGWDEQVQREWAERPVRDRVHVLRVWRYTATRQTDAFCTAVHAEPTRTKADVLVTEILPLLAACEFLEENAAKVLAVRRLGPRGRPVWIGRVSSEIHRVALGRVLVIGPSNYPLFLPGVQVLQALAAGNAVTWKPGRGGAPVAKLFAATMTQSGLPRELLRLADDTDEAGKVAVAAGADKVFFTGSATTGQAVMRKLAESATPSVMELSDNAAVIVLPEAKIERAVAATVFGVRLNGSATCMAPRRLLVMGCTAELRERMVEQLTAEFAKVAPVTLDRRVRSLLKELVDEAERDGATVVGQVSDLDQLGIDRGQLPLLVVGARPEMRIAQTDIFAPVLSVIDVTDTDALLAAQRACPLALTVSIFGDEPAARRLAGRMRVGTVVINDLIAPTVDPRVPFGGRRGSGFGVTRGAEGLLEMTAVKTVMVQRGESTRHYQPTGEVHASLFQGLIHAGHTRTWRDRWAGVRLLVRAARSLNAKEKEIRSKNKR